MVATEQWNNLPGFDSSLSAEEKRKISVLYHIRVRKSCRFVLVGYTSRESILIFDIPNHVRVFKNPLDIGGPNLFIKSDNIF